MLRATHTRHDVQKGPSLDELANHTALLVQKWSAIDKKRLSPQELAKHGPGLDLHLVDQFLAAVNHANAHGTYRDAPEGQPIVAALAQLTDYLQSQQERIDGWRAEQTKPEIQRGEYAKLEPRAAEAIITYEKKKEASRKFEDRAAAAFIAMATVSGAMVGVGGAMIGLLAGASVGLLAPFGQNVIDYALAGPVKADQRLRAADASLRGACIR